MQMPMRALVLVGLLAFFDQTHPLYAEQWPERPVKIVLPFAAGGAGDIAARILAQDLHEAFQQPFVVENRPSASGVVAAEIVAHAPADGYTLFMGTVGQIAVLPAMMKTAYDPIKDFAPISIVGTNPFVLVVHLGMPVHSVAEFVDYARKHPGTVTYASSGPGSLVHLSMALLRRRAALDLIAVSYKGGAAPMSDVIAGHVNSYFATLASVMPHADDGSLRLLAVSSEKRAAQIPTVPTMIESGFPGFRVLTWNGLLAPAGTPNEIIARLAREAARATKDPLIAAHLVSEGIDPLGNTPEEFAATIVSDSALWAEAINSAGVEEK